MGEPVCQLPQRSWLTCLATQRIIAGLTADGTPARFVGGSVRDTLLGRKTVKDIDVVTTSKPDKVIELMKRIDVRTVPTGITHGTVTALINGLIFEITTLRCDVVCDGRHALVTYTDNWRQDAARRDFTINALFADPDGTVYDPFGSGITDLYHGYVRFIGAPYIKIKQDILRLLRYFRFYGLYSCTVPDQDALLACRMLASYLNLLSPERTREELLRILMVPRPHEVLLLMEQEHVLQYILPEAKNFLRLRMLVELERCYASSFPAVSSNAIRRLAAVLSGQAFSVARRLRLSNHMTTRLVRMLEWLHTVLSPDDIERLLRCSSIQALGQQHACDLVLLLWANQLAATSNDERVSIKKSSSWFRLLEMTGKQTVIAFPVNGVDVQELGIPSGPKVGFLLQELRKWWEDHNYQSDRETLLTKLKQLTGQYKENT